MIAELEKENTWLSKNAMRGRIIELMMVEDEYPNYCDKDSRLCEGNLGIRKEYMPQIKGSDQPEFRDFLSRRGIESHYSMRIPSDLTATQSDISTSRVRRIIERTLDSYYKTSDGKPFNVVQQLPIIITGYDHKVLDGHHRWASAYIMNPRMPIPVLVVDTTMKRLIRIVEDFDKVGRAAFNYGGSLGTTERDSPVEPNYNLENQPKLHLEVGGFLQGRSSGKLVKHSDGSKGGYAVGRRHSTGGIKGINLATGGAIEFEGGEVVITRNAVSDTTKREFNGKKMTNKEILSEINQGGGGVAIMEDGGQVGACGREYEYNGSAMTDYNILRDLARSYEDGGLIDAYEGAKLSQSRIKDIQEDIKLADQSIDVLRGEIEKLEMLRQYADETGDLAAEGEATLLISQYNDRINDFSVLRYGNSFDSFTDIAWGTLRQGNLKNNGFISEKDSYLPNIKGHSSSNLPESLLRTVKTPRFQDWFGDWEREDAGGDRSVAVDDNGEPLVLYHGTSRVFSIFRSDGRATSGFYLAENRAYAEYFTQMRNDASRIKRPSILPLFVNMKNPIDLTIFGVEKTTIKLVMDFMESQYPFIDRGDIFSEKELKTINESGIQIWAWQFIRNFDKFVRYVRDFTPYDGFVYYENNPDAKDSQGRELVTKAFFAFDSNQIKSVHAYLFDGGMHDIRLEKGGNV